MHPVPTRLFLGPSGTQKRIEVAGLAVGNVKIEQVPYRTDEEGTDVDRDIVVQRVTGYVFHYGLDLKRYPGDEIRVQEFRDVDRR